MKEIKNITIYSKEKVKEFLEIYYFERVKGVRALLNILIAVIIISFITKDSRSTLDMITFIFSLFGVLEVNTSMLPRLNLYKLIKKKDSIIDSKITYVFKKNNFKLNKDEYIDYNTLKKVIETNTSYYLYINSSRALIVDKEVLTEEDINTLTNIFKEQVSTYKYKNNVWQNNKSNWEL